ncbi:hypothetical protein KKD70_02985 [Patescibacteria group bacterium]|nr:hypothetical protein [Patescibacteria group bacterium]
MNYKKFLSLFGLSIILSTNLAGIALAGDPKILFETFEPELNYQQAQFVDMEFQPIFNDDPADPYIDDPGIYIELEGALTQDGRAALNWTPYLKPNFSMYKVVHDQMDPEPYYPKHGYLDYFDDPHKTGYLTGMIPDGDNFFRICVITQDDKRGCSNSVNLFREAEFAAGSIGAEPFIEEEPEIIPDRALLEEENNVIVDRPVREINQKAGVWQLISKFAGNNLGTIVAIITVIIAVSGFTFASKNKRKSISKYINQIDDTYSEYKMKAKRCEAELYRLKDILDDQLKTAKLDDGAYQLLINRIEGYMIDIQKQIVNEKFGGLPSTMKEQMFKMMEDGEITESEFEAMQTLIKRSELSATEQDNLLSTIKDFKKQDEMMKKGRKE